MTSIVPVAGRHQPAAKATDQPDVNGLGANFASANEQPARLAPAHPSSELTANNQDHEATGSGPANLGAQRENSSQLHSNSTTKQISKSSPLAGKFKMTADEQQQQAPLVHTERLNATSGLLFIQPTGTQDNRQEAAESGEWPARVAILSATFAPTSSANRRMGQLSANLQEQADAGPEAEMESAPDLAELVPRLMVLNLEVAPTSATLTWSFGLFPAATKASSSLSTIGDNEPPIDRRENKSQLNSARLKRSPPTRSGGQVRKRDTMRVRGANKEEGSGARAVPEPPLPANEDEFEDGSEEPAIAEPTADRKLPANQTNEQPASRLTVSKRLRLSQVQSLPAGQSHRRPPARGTTSTSSSTTQEPPSELSLVLGELSDGPEAARGDDEEDEVETPTTTTTTTSTTTTTARPAPGQKQAQPKPTRAGRLNRTKSIEAPMIRTPSVLLNRLTSGIPGTRAPVAVARREPKALVAAAPPPLSEQAPSGSNDTSTPSEPTTSTSTTPATQPPPTTTTTTSTTTTPQPRSEARTTTTPPEVDSSSSRSMSVSPPAVLVAKQSLVTSTSSGPTTGRPSQQRKPAGRESKWLVRLRRFGSNEIDIVKVVVSQASLERVSRPSLRYISFKNLQPQSAYELCVESASPNQQVADSYQILNANHFLKCHDTSDVEIANATSELAETDQNKLKRMDLRAEFSEVQSSFRSSEVAGGPVAMPLASGSQGPLEGPPAKVKSLCREFFTLPLNGSLYRLNFGMADEAGNSSPSPEALRNRTLALASVQNLRKPKSLNNVLRSRMEVLEISGSDESRPGGSWFEMVASPGSRATGRLAPTASDNNPNVLRALPDEPNFELNRPGSGSNANYLTVTSLLPILACVFGLIFILTLANMILNAITCRKATSGRQRARRRPLDHRNFNNHNNRRQQFYADSDHSNSSKSRIVVVGKNGEPFAATSAYFEIPMDTSGARGALRSPELSSLEASSSNCLGAGGSGGRHSSTTNLLVSGARFPLGPSFEGDERHNADMVGLARKNYDNFISNIYGANSSTGSLSDAGQQPEGGSPASGNALPVVASKARASHHKHRHQHHRRAASNSQLAEPPADHEEKLREEFEAEQRTSGADKRQRIRFDKINPIYNMDSFYASHKPAARSSVSTFASHQHHQDASSGASLLESPQAKRKSAEGQLTSESANDNCCPACQLEEEAQLATSGELSCSREQSLEQCDGENCDDGSFYTCCLDRQKQRFQKQQQQLERVMTKNGSLVPQPFINPAGCPALEPSESAYELERPNPETELEQEADRDQQELKVESPLLGAPPDVASVPVPPPEPEAPVMFDEQSALDAKSVTLPPGGNLDLKQLPSNSSQSTGRKAPAKRAPTGSEPNTLTINIQSLGGTMINAKGRLRDEKLEEAINKDDFNQRRKELANKLNLVGMSKPTHLCHCQQQQAGPASDFFSSSQSPAQLPVAGSRPELSAESRADNQRQASALNELVNFLSNYANQPINRRPPLMQQQQQQQQANNNIRPLPAGTPGNPFLGAPNRPRPMQFPGQNPNPNQNQVFASSSPATPVNYLTLSRLASFANGNQPPPFSQPNNINNNRLNNPFNNQQQQPQPARQTIPAGVPPRGMQPQRTGGPGLQMRPLASVPLPAVASQPGLLNKPASGGFAPSGPPPSMAAGTGQLAGSSDEPAATTSSAATFSPSESPATNQPEPAQTTSRLPVNETRQGASSTLPPPTTVKPEAGSETEAAPEASSWNPVVELNKTSSEAAAANKPKSHTTSLAPSPDIVTVPPGYNPDAPASQSYDINVSAQMGSGGAGTSGELAKAPEVVASAPSSVVVASGAAIEPTISVAPTAVTTIIWSPPADERLPPGSSSQPVAPEPTSRLAAAEATRVALPAGRIRDNSLGESSTAGSGSEPPPQTTTTAGVVYGKAPARDAKPTAPPAANPAASGEQTGQGKPFIQSVQIDNQVRPYAAPSSELPARNRSPPAAPFKASRPLQAGNSLASGMSIGSGFTITANGSNQTMPAGDIQDYLANQPPILLPGERPSSSSSSESEPTISAQGGPDPFQAANATSTSTSAPLPPAVKIRRPTFKPKPAVPPIRIDSCIVGDDSSCDQSHNERCVTEYGISSCHCKPGFARLSQLRGYCSPISLYQLSMRIERLSDDRKLAFNHTLENPNSEEYQYLEFEAVQALASAFQQTSLGRHFMGTKVNKFYERKGKVWANLSVSFELNNLTRSERVQTLAAQELQRLLTGTGSAGKRPQLGESTIVLENRSGESLSRLTDVNECASKDLNDCSKFATCTNDFGGYQCHCLAGYEDKQNSAKSAAEAGAGSSEQQLDRARLTGRVCLGCSASFCSNRGECSIVDGRKSCKCRANFVGARCDIDSEVLTVAVGGSLVGIVILVITFWCLYVFNRRWKREQQKMDAMSATSGLTFNYVNSANNSLMSPPVGKLLGAPTGRSLMSQPHQLVGGYGQKFGGGGRGANGYLAAAADQQAIIGSTSSSSSAASIQQPIALAGMYQYAPEEAGLLIAPASNGSSSQQSSPSSSTGNGNASYARGPFNMLLPGNAYTLSGHHQAHQLVVQPHEHHHHHHHHQRKQSMAQFNPGLAADYARTMNACQAPTGGQYEGRWRTLQQQEAKQQQHLVGYYLSPDMLMSSQQQQQQLYASPQRELCIDTGLSANNKSARRQPQTGRALQNQPGANQRAGRLHRNGSMYIDPEYEQESRRI